MPYYVALSRAFLKKDGVGFSDTLSLAKSGRKWHYCVANDQTGGIAVISRRLSLAISSFMCCAALCCCGSWAASLDQATIASIDKRVADTPQSAAGTVQSLADYLAKSATNDAQKVRAIYSWIVRNIDYDVAALAAGNTGDQSAEATLSKRKAVCAGYSRLFLALTQAAGVEAAEVDGFSRGAGYVAGSSLGSEPDHAWSAVKLDGSWYVLDCTWAAGYLDAEHGFVRKLDDYYYLTPPDHFIYDHLPQDAKWQMAANPITKEDFERLVYLRPGFFRCGLEVASHPHIEIECDGNLTVAFTGPDDALVRARVGAAQASDDVAPTFVQHDGDKLKVNASFPHAGDYLLRLYAKKRGDQGPYDWAADYMVKVSQAPAQAASYPQEMATFQESSSRLYAPLSGRLKAGGTEAFKLSVPGAEAVAVVAGGDWQQLEKHGDVWEGEAKAKGDQLQVAARFPGSQSFYILLTYVVS